MRRWILSNTYINDQAVRIPVAADYADEWIAPRHPAEADGVSLVRVSMTSSHLGAAAQDSRVTICPALGSLPAPVAVITAYASWGATAGMTMDALISKLAETEPAYLMID
jgi:hypothetical protein